MNTGILFTSLVSFLLFVASLALSLHLWKNRVLGDKKMLAYNWFWLITSLLWFFAALRLFFAWQGMFEADRVLFFVDQIFVFLTPVPLLYYLLLKIFKNRKLSNFSLIIVSFFSGLSMFLLFKFGISESGITYFVTKFQPNIYAFNIFLFLSLMIISFAGYDVFKRTLSFLRKKDPIQKAEFFYSLAILLYLLIGIFDERGLVTGWHLVVFRLLYLMVFLLVYLVFDSQIIQKKNIIEYIAE